MVDSSETNGSAGEDEPREAVEERRAPPMQLDFDDDHLLTSHQATQRQATQGQGKTSVTDTPRPASEPPISEQPESDAEPISLRDLEMVFAPGVSPPALPTKRTAPDQPRRQSTIPPPLPGRAAAAAHRHVAPAPGSDPELSIPAPLDSDLGDIAAFASLNPPPVHAKRSPRNAERAPAQTAESAPPTDAEIPGAPRLPDEEPRRAARRLDSEGPVADSDRPRPPRKAARIDKRRQTDEPPSEPPPNTGRRGRRSERPTKESGSGIHDLRMIVSMHPVAAKPDVDDEMLNLSGGLSGGLFREDVPLAPIIAPDLSAFSTEAADEAPPPSRRAKRRHKHNDSPPSSRSPESVPKSRRAKTGKSSGASRKKPGAEVSPRERASKDAEPESPRSRAVAADTEPKSRLGLWIFAAAALAVGGYVYVSSGQTEAPAPTPVAESKTRTDPKTGESPVGEAPSDATGKPAATGTAEDTAVAADTPTTSGTVTGAWTGDASDTGWQPGEEPSGEQPTGEEPTGEEPTGEEPTGEAPTGEKPSGEAPAGEKPSAPKAEFNKGAASAALSAAAGAASGCRTGSDPAGSARVMVTFAPSGRATQALVAGPPFAGTATGGCIAKAFRSAAVPPFEGDPVTVAKTAQIQ